MSHRNELQQMAVEDLAQHCAHETELYKKQKDSDPSYCFELFRRAIVGRDNDAWGAIYARYQPQVAGWVSNHRNFRRLNQEAQDLSMQALERFLKYFTAEKFNKSQSLAAVLSYLKFCVNSVIMDCLRKMSQGHSVPLKEDQERKIPDNSPRIEDALGARELWQLVKSRLKDNKEYTLVYASITLGLKASQILVEYPDVFRDISEIYRCSANVWARLQRDPEIRNFLKLE